MSVVWRRHLIASKREPTLSGKDDIMDTRQKRGGHFVGHCERGRKNRGLWKLTGYKLPQSGVYGERQGSQSTVGWLFNHTGWLRALNLGRRKTIGTSPPVRIAPVRVLEL